MISGYTGTERLHRCLKKAGKDNTQITSGHVNDKLRMSSMVRMAFSVTIPLLFVLCSLLAFKAADVSNQAEEFHSPFSQDTDLPYTVFTKEELSKYDGSDTSLPIYVAIKGVVFDVSKAATFYGPGGAYNGFAGKDASRALAKMSMEKEDLNDQLDDLPESQLRALDEAFDKLYVAKYRTVGYLKGHEPHFEDNSSFKPKHREL